MLKRCQILLSDWQIEYAKFVSKMYDISFSEAIRLEVCLGILKATKEVHPKHKIKYSLKKSMKELEKASRSEERQEVLHRNVSELYFEARKAAEYRLSQQKK